MPRLFPRIKISSISARATALMTYAALSIIHAAIFQIAVITFLKAAKGFAFFTRSHFLSPQRSARKLFVSMPVAMGTSATSPRRNRWKCLRASINTFPWGFSASRCLSLAFTTLRQNFKKFYSPSRRHFSPSTRSPGSP